MSSGKAFSQFMQKNYSKSIHNIDKNVESYFLNTFAKSHKTTLERANKELSQYKITNKPHGETPSIPNQRKVKFSEEHKELMFNSNSKPMDLLKHYKPTKQKTKLEVGKEKHEGKSKKQISEKTKLKKTTKKKLKEELKSNKCNNNGKTKKKDRKSHFKENYSNHYTLSRLHENKWEEGRLPYIALGIGEEEDDIEVEAMVDSGASHTYISMDLFERIEDHENMIKERKNIDVYLGKGILSGQAKVAVIPLLLKDEHGKTYKVLKRVTALAELDSNTMFLGSDFQYNREKVKYLETRGIHLIIPWNSNETTLIPYKWKRKQDRLQVLMLDGVRLAPGQASLVRVYPEYMPRFAGTYMIDNGSDDVDEGSKQANEDLPDLHVQQALVRGYHRSRPKPPTYKLLVTNKSDKDYIDYPADMPIAWMTREYDKTLYTLDMKPKDTEDSDTDEFEDTYQLNKIEVRVNDPIEDLEEEDDPLDDDTDELLPNADNLDHEVGIGLDEIKADFERKREAKILKEALDKINNNTEWTDEEKIQKLEDFRQYGYIDLPASTVIENSGNVTEFAPMDDRRKTAEEVVSEVKLSHLEPEVQKQVKELCMEFNEIFTRSEMDITPNKLGIEADCILKPSYDANRTSNAKMRPFPLQIREDVQEILDRMERNGLISDCKTYSPIISQLLIGKKKATNKPRIILDLRATNAACLKIPAQLPNQQEIFSLFSGKKYITACDIANFFFTIPMKKEKRPLFCFFDTKNVRKMLNVCPQGYRNASAYAAELTAELLRGLYKNHRAFVDDIWTATPAKETEEESIKYHLDQLRLLFVRLKNSGLKIKPSKLEPMKETVEILGYVYKAGKFSIPEHRCLAIQNIPKPYNFKGVKSFIALISYFRIFIWNYSFYCVPLHDMLRRSNGKKVVWDDAANKAFKQLKILVAKAIQISAPMYDREFKISVDASLNAYGTLLYQTDDNNEPIFLGCASKLFCQADRNKSSFFREVIGLVASLLHFRFYLEFARDVIVFTDALSILWMKAVREGSPKLVELAMQMSKYELTIKHIPRQKENWAPDILSRFVDPDRVKNEDPALSVADADRLFNMVTVPNGYEIPKELLKEFLKERGLPSLKTTSRKKTAAKVDITPNHMKPLNMPKKKVTLPRTSTFDPRYQNQQAQAKENPYDFYAPGRNKVPEEYEDEVEYLEEEVEDNPYMNEEYSINTLNYPMQRAWTESEDHWNRMDYSYTPSGDYEDVIQKMWMDEDKQYETQRKDFLNLHSCITSLINNETLNKLECFSCHSSNEREQCLSTLRLVGGRNSIEDTADEEDLVKYKNNENHGEDDDEEKLQINDEDQEDEAYETSQLESFILNNKIISAGKITIGILREAQKTCPYTQNIIKQMNAKQLTMKKNEYFFRKGVLLFRNKKTQKEKIVLPKNLLPSIVHHMHFSFWNSHANPGKIHETISEIYHAKGLKDWITETLPNCFFCDTEQPFTKRKITIGKMKSPEYPRQRFYADLAFGFEHISGFTGIIVFLDAFSLFTLAYPIRGKTAEELLTIFKRYIFSPYAPEQIMSDRENALTSEEFRKFCIQRSVKQQHTAAHSPWQNSACETTIKLLKTKLREFCKGTNRNWLDALPDVLVGFNKRTLKSGYTPEQIFFGNKTYHEDLLKEETKVENFKTYMDYFMAYAKEVRKAHIEKREKQADIVRNVKNKHTTDYTYNVGDVVYLKDLTIAETVGKATKVQFIGPYEIIKINEHENTCEIEKLDGKGTRIAHLQHLKKSINMPTLRAPAETDASELLKEAKKIKTAKEKAAEETQSFSNTLRRSERIKKKKEKST